MNVTLMVLLTGLLPKILLNILGVFVTEKFLAGLIEDAVIFMLRKGAKLSATDYDDKKVEEIALLIKARNEQP